MRLPQEIAVGGKRQIIAQADDLKIVLFNTALHGFMLFVIFNAMVVFESGLIRWAGVAMVVWLAAVAAYRRSQAQSAIA